MTVILLFGSEHTPLTFARRRRRAAVATGTTVLDAVADALNAA